MTWMWRAAQGDGSWRHLALRVVRFELRALLLTVLGYGLVFASSPLSAPGVHAAAPRVVIVVGPAGRATDGYRADGDQAAKVARAAGADVTKVYSPNATWPKVKAALQGASIVIYMGHGNGFPSRYGLALRKSTKDGVGLNPVAGVDDVAHQYFGESYLAKYVRLAPHAVVLLHHLCYASGNSEPGLPEGGLATGQQRVDNMAAGWLAAGAEAVLAEAYGDPAHYVGRILAGRTTVEAIWRTGPTAHDHVLAFPSTRTPGMTGLMDPTKKSSGFYRSLVVRAELRADEVAAGAALVGGARGSGTRPSSSPLARAIVSDVTLKGLPTVGARLDLDVAFGGPDSGPRDLGVGVRWDPIVLDQPVPVAISSAPASGPSESGAPSATPGTSGSSGSPGPSAPAGTATTANASPSAEPSRAPEPSIDPPSVPPMVVPETLGDVVALVDVERAERSLTAAIVAPEVPGLYRLVTSLHDADGAALDPPNEGAVPGLLVRVTRSLSAVVGTTKHIDVVAEFTVDMPVAVMNSGTVPWVDEDRTPEANERKMPPSDPKAILVGHWVRLDASSQAEEAGPVWTTVGPDPGATEVTTLGFTAPVRPGEYLLVLDVMSPLDGSLTAAGGEPVVVRVTVVPRGTIGGS